MKICIACEYFPPFGPGGGEISIFYQAEGLANSGQKVVVVTPDYGATGYEERDNMKICRFPFFKKLKTGEQCNPIFLANPLFYLYFLFHLVKICRKERIEIIHSQTNNAIIPSFLASKILGIRYVATLRDTTLLCGAGLLCLHEEEHTPSYCGILRFIRCLWTFDRRYYPEWHIVNRVKSIIHAFFNEFDLSLKRMAIRKADAVITVSDGLKKVYQRSGIKVKEIITVYNNPPSEGMIDKRIQEEAAERHRLKGRRIILYAGKMSYGKGTDVLIRAIEPVIEEIPQTLFIFLGKKNCLIPFPEKLKDSYFTPGFISHKEAQTFFALADVVVVPSIWQEPLSRVLLEGMNFSKPLVATRVGGTPEAVIDGKTGLLVERGDDKALAKAIITILKDRHRAEVMGREGKKLLEERFAVEKNIVRLLKVYGNSTPD
jgi:glycosyltransferase involved in cell wall biosynthesis